MDRVFVTGGSGFVGRNLLSALHERGVGIQALVRSEAAAEVVKRVGAEPVRGDLGNKAVLNSGMEGCDTVFHVAAVLGNWGRYEDSYRVNVAGTENVIAAAQKVGVPRFVHVSTDAVLSDGKPTVNADESRVRSRRPLGLYALTKGLAEERVLAAASGELAAMIVRPRFIWGEGDTTILPTMIEATRKGQLRWIGGGHFSISTCHVANVCEGLILAARRGRGGEVYFVTDGAPVEFRGFISELLRTQGVEPPEGSIPPLGARFFASGGELAWQALRLKGAPPLTRATLTLIGQEMTVNDAKARRELGYANVVSREEGLEAMRHRAVQAAAS